ncbi:MAG: hypothetical protein FJY83_09055 [Candidatus Aminicenantes bacterium]|nr:hypothetical protein [Candidatus Aminicenantes bacterium]
MSHSLHRFGRPPDLRDDWIILAMSSRDVNKKGSAPLLRRFLEIALRHDPLNWGDIRQGSRYSPATADLLAGVSDESIVHAVYASREATTSCLQDLRREDLGLSVVVSGLMDDVRRAAAGAGLKPHTAAWSLGVWGKTDRLPPAEVLEVTTMCGHGLVSPNSVRAVAALLREGRLTAEEAAARLSRPCVCGIFNPVRAARCLRRLARGADEDGLHRA